MIFDCLCITKSRHSKYAEIVLQVKGAIQQMRPKSFDDFNFQHTLTSSVIPQEQSDVMISNLLKANVAMWDVCRHTYTSWQIEMIQQIMHEM